ncbi:MAG: TetR/AcrR family transcriptional regulator [Myxococcales bacterium]|nr:TetR/AcrR family transcriptional regulator [Myxococcales bacterium]MBK7198282.1 TetR/AcrR family transcriptional regulator [Myxococcales bacterium]
MTSPRRRAGRPAHPIERPALVAIAAQAFAERGYAAASLGEIAAAAGLRKASLYHHFPAKEALYNAVLDTTVGELRALLLAAGLDAGDFAGRLDRLGALMIDYFVEHPHAAKLLTRELAGDGDYLRGAGGAQVMVNLHATAAFLQAGMDAGAFRRQDPRQLVMSIVGLHVFYFATASLASDFVGKDVRAAATVAARKAAVLAQVRGMCLAAPPTAAPPSTARRRRG